MFTDVEGRHWTVGEELLAPGDWNPSDDDSHRAGYGVGWLHFTSAHMRKRLRLFPRHWRTLSDAELASLSQRALAVQPRS